MSKRTTLKVDPVEEHAAAMRAELDQAMEQELATAEAVEVPDDIFDMGVIVSTAIDEYKKFREIRSGLIRDRDILSSQIRVMDKRMAMALESYKIGMMPSEGMK